MEYLIAALLFGGFLLAAKSFFFSFRAQSPDDYAETGPAFSMNEHLNGEIRSEGVIYGPRGRMSSRFVARMVGEWDGNSGTLTEDFTYSTGRRQQRKWHLTLGPGNKITGTANDIVGEAQGKVSGATAMLRYRIVLPPEAGGHKLDTTDWMYLTADGAIMNKSEMRLFGVKVAELVATLRPDWQAAEKDPIASRGEETKAVLSDSALRPGVYEAGLAAGARQTF